MNKLAKASIIKGRSLSFHQDTHFEGYAFSYPLVAVKRCHYDVKVERIGDYAHAAYTISATLSVLDSRDNVPFDKKMALSEDVDILDEEDNAGEGYVVQGGDIDLEELALRILVSSLPIRLVRSEEVALPKSGKGYRFISEDEHAEEKVKEGDPRLASLKDFEVKK
jgi:Predicted metal-binding, possibly nucleic acid-binding protein